MAAFTVDPTELMQLARRMDVLASDLASATTLRGTTTGIFGSGRVDGAMSSFISHQSDGLRALHTSIANGSQRVADAAAAYAGTERDIAGVAEGR